MTKTLSLIVALAALALAGPAWAVPIPTCTSGDFTLIAKNKIGTENGPLKLEDNNVLVTADDGEAFIGAHNKIGKVIAHEIFVGTGAVVKDCIGDVITGPGTCLAKSSTFAASGAGCHAIPFAPEVVDLCVNTALAVNVPAGQTETLAPGCYGVVRVSAGATLNLQSGLYFIRQLSTLLGSTIQGVPGSKMRVKNGVNFTAKSRILDVDLFSAGAIGTLQIGNETDLTGSLIVALFSGIHLHTGTVLDDATVVGLTIVAEPVTGKSGDTTPFCKCNLGFHVPGIPPVCVPD